MFYKRVTNKRIESLENQVKDLENRVRALERDSEIMIISEDYPFDLNPYGFAYNPRVSIKSAIAAILRYLNVNLDYKSETSHCVLIEKGKKDA